MMIKRPLLPRAAVFVAVFVLFFSLPPAAANISKTPWYSEISGVPYPQKENRVNVEKEQLIFDLRESVTDAQVSANYSLYNRSNQSINLPVAFALYASPWTDLENMTVQIEGTEVPTRTVWLYELLWPQVEEWVEEHRDFVSMAKNINRFKEAGQKQKAKLLDETLYNGLMSSGVAVNMQDGTYDNMKDFMAEKEFVAHENPYESMEIVRLIAPVEVKDAEDAWKSESDRTEWPDPVGGGTYRDQFAPGSILGLALFNIELPANGKRSVYISYLQSPSRDEIKDIAHFQYLLQPASKWDSFENLNVQVLLPEDLPFTSNLSLKQNGDEDFINYSGNFSDLPDKNLVLSVKVPEGAFGDGGSGYGTVIIIFIAFILVFILALALMFRILYKFIKSRKMK